MIDFNQYKVSVPTGRSGDYEVSRFVVRENDRKALYYALHGRPVPMGEYTRLTNNGKVIMSDTPAEIHDHADIIRRATGRVLLNGLGLGVVLQAIISKPGVSHIDIVEISEDVIHLVAPSYPQNHVHIYHGDAFTIKWPRGTRWDVIWHDIWENICPDNSPEMVRLHRKYAGRCSWQGSWARSLCRGLLAWERGGAREWARRNEMLAALTFPPS